MKSVKAVALGLFVILLILFVVQNLQALSHSESLKLDILVTSFSTPPLMMALLLLACLAIGYLTAYLLGFTERRKLKKSLKSLQSRLSRTEEELHSLRNLPITGDPGAPVENGLVNVNGSNSEVG